MITFYATSPHGYTFHRFVEGWAPQLASRVRVLGYSEIDLAAPVNPGLHILTDFERLLVPERALATRLYRRLRRRPGIRVIGDPTRWLNRHQLLTHLADEGINDFRAYTVDQLGPEVRFPVFLRWANEHSGSLGGPIPNRKVLDRRLAEISRLHHRRMRWIRDQLLIVEKRDARSPDGLFRKYSVLRIGDEYIARHMIVTDRWVSKYPSVVNPELVQEEEAFLNDPCDLDLVKQAFAIAGIQFGRIDWGYANGRPQIWEINTNPMLAPGDPPHELRLPGQVRQSQRTVDAIERQIPRDVDTGQRALIPAPERWAWQFMNRGSRYWDPKRR